MTFPPLGIINTELFCEMTGMDWLTFQVLSALFVILQLGYYHVLFILMPPQSFYVNVSIRYRELA